MSEKVFLSGYSIRAPGINTSTDLYQALFQEDFNPEFTDLFVAENQYSKVGCPNFSLDEKLLPKPSLQKTMRDDVLAACICIKELIETFRISEAELESFPLFVCNGNTLEPMWNNAQFLKDWFSDFDNKPSESELSIFLHQATPPLLALRTLTNATESFVSQVGRIGGNNGSFGATSLSGFYVLEEACSRIQRGECEAAIAGGSFLSGYFSHLSHEHFTGTEVRQESTCAIFVLLESEKRHKSLDRPMGWLLDDMRSVARIGSLFDECLRIPYKDSIKHCQDGVIVYSGGLTTSGYEKETKSLHKTGLPLYSCFPSLGHLGAVSMLMNLVAGTSLLKHNISRAAYCLDSDPYGRESMIRISQLS